MVRCFTAAVAAALLAALGATSASAAVLTLSEGGAPLVPGDTFEVTGIGNVEVHTSSGSLGCSGVSGGYNGLELSLTTNASAKDEAQIEYLVGRRAENCHSFTGNAFVTLQSIAGPLVLRASGKASAGAVGVTVEFEHIAYREDGREHYGPVYCEYGGKKLTGTNNATTTREALSIELAGKMQLAEGSPKGCPKKAEVFLSLPFSSNLSGEEATIEEQT
jgi:hypothetical protein